MTAAAPKRQNPLSPARGEGWGEGWLRGMITSPPPALSPIGGEGKNQENSIKLIKEMEIGAYINGRLAKTLPDTTALPPSFKGGLKKRNLKCHSNYEASPWLELPRIPLS